MTRRYGVHVCSCEEIGVGGAGVTTWTMDEKTTTPRQSPPNHDVAGLTAVRFNLERAPPPERQAESNDDDDDDEVAL